MKAARSWSSPTRCDCSAIGWSTRRLRRLRCRWARLAPDRIGAARCTNPFVRGILAADEAIADRVFFLLDHRDDGFAHRGVEAEREAALHVGEIPGAPRRQELTGHDADHRVGCDGLTGA